MKKKKETKGGTLQVYTIIKNKENEKSNDN